MAEYLIITNAEQRSRTEAQQRAAGLQSGAITEYWHSWITHPITGQQAIVIENEADKEFLTTEELTALLSQEDAEAADWFLSFDEGV